MVDGLEQSLGVHLVGFFLDVAEVLGLCALVAQTFLMGVEHDVLVGDAAGNLFFAAEEDRLGNVADSADGPSLLQFAAELHGILLAHAVKDDVGTAVAEDALVQPVLPVVVVGEAAQGSLNAAQNHGNVGEELFQDAGVDNGGIVGAHVVARVGAVGVFMA